MEGTPAGYKPGAFYKRELPLLLSILADIEEPVDVILIDGYVWLGANGEPGLGAHLYAHLGSRIPVIGVAKNRYQQDNWSIPVIRGTSQRPLFVTSAGIDPKQAASYVQNMHDAHRIPTILALADRAARDGLSA